MNTDPGSLETGAHRRARRALYAHAAVYLVVNAMLLLLDTVTGGGWWFFWPLFGWAIGLAAHSVGVVLNEAWNGPEREEAAIRRYMEQHSAR